MWRNVRVVWDGGGRWGWGVKLEWILFKLATWQMANTVYKYSDRQDWENSADPDEMPHNAASHLGLHCLPLIQQFLVITTDIKFYLFKF